MDSGVDALRSAKILTRRMVRAVETKEHKYRRVEIVRNAVVEQQRLVLRDHPTDRAYLELVVDHSAKVVALCRWWACEPSFDPEVDARRDLDFVLGYAEALVLLGDATGDRTHDRDAAVLLRAALRLEPWSEVRVYVLLGRLYLPMTRRYDALFFD